MGDSSPSRSEDRRKSSYLDKVLGTNMDTKMDEVDEGAVSEDDLMEDEDEGPWFSMGMSREEKIQGAQAMEMESHHQIGR